MIITEWRVECLPTIPNLMAQGVEEDQLTRDRIPSMMHLTAMCTICQVSYLVLCDMTKGSLGGSGTIFKQAVDVDICGGMVVAKTKHNSAMVS